MIALPPKFVYIIKQLICYLYTIQINAKIVFFTIYLLFTSQFLFYSFHHQVIGYGGDQIGLIDFFNRHPDIKIHQLGVYDFILKLLANYFELGVNSLTFLTFSAITINYFSALLLRPYLIKLFNINENNSYLSSLLIACEPLTISLILSGHVAFFPAVAFLFSLIFSYRSFIWNLIGIIILFFLNPYLCIGYLIFSTLLDIYLRNTNRINFYIIIFIFLVIKFIFERYVFETYTFNFFDIVISNRLVPSGIFPLNYFFPDTNSLIGRFFIDGKNIFYTYLNVPESNYSLIILFVFILFSKNDINHQNLFIWVVLFLAAAFLTCFPPYTTKFGGIYFPTIIINQLLPELRIISRNSSYIYCFALVFLISRLKINFSPLLFFTLVVFLPLHFPHYNPTEIDIKECVDHKSLTIHSDDPWNMYYSRYFGYKIIVSPTLNESLQFSTCRLKDTNV